MHIQYNRLIANVYLTNAAADINQQRTIYIKF